jgi:hypothetical protein
MRYLQVIGLLALLGFGAGCDPSGDQPTGPSSNGKDTTELTMLSIGKDSLYWRETSWIVLNQKRDSIGGLVLFVGSHTMTIDSCVGGKLYFRSQTGAESGAFRLYDREKQAKGDVRVTFLAHDIEFAAFVNFSGTRQCYIGETLFFEIREMPWRDGDYEFLIGEKSLTLKGSKPEGSVGYLFFTVPEGATDGMLRARVLDREIEFGQFTILNHQKSYLQERHIRSVDIRVGNLLGTTLIRTADSNLERDRVTAWLQYAFEDLDNVTLDDDTLQLHQLRTAGGHFELDLAIAEDNNGMLSGRISIISRIDGLKTEQRMAVTFKDLPWRDDYEKYESVAMGPQVQEQLMSFTYKSISDGVVIEEARYAGGDISSVFVLTIDR